MSTSTNPKEHGIPDLLQFKDRLLDYLGYRNPNQKGTSKPRNKARKFVRNTLSPLIQIPITSPQGNHCDRRWTLKAINFDDAGLFVWNVLAKMLDAGDPFAFRSELTAAFGCAEAGLSAAQFEQVLSLRAEIADINISVFQDGPFKLPETPEARALRQQEEAAAAILKEKWLVGGICG